MTETGTGSGCCAYSGCGRESGGAARRTSRSSEKVRELVDHTGRKLAFGEHSASRHAKVMCAVRPPRCAAQIRRNDGSEITAASAMIAAQASRRAFRSRRRTPHPPRSRRSGRRPDGCSVASSASATKRFVATPAFMSLEPRPYRRLPSISPPKASRVQGCVPRGTVSMWPERISERPPPRARPARAQDSACLHNPARRKQRMLVQARHARRVRRGPVPTGSAQHRGQRIAGNRLPLPIGGVFSEGAAPDRRSTRTADPG